jgi:hypothetical protein
MISCYVILNYVAMYEQVILNIDIQIFGIPASVFCYFFNAEFFLVRDVLNIL